VCVCVRARACVCVCARVCVCVVGEETEEKTKCTSLHKRSAHSGREWLGHNHTRHTPTTGIMMSHDRL